MMIMARNTILILSKLLALNLLGLVLAETPKIATGDDYPDPKEIPLYGVSGRPRYQDVQQVITLDCWLEAPLSSIARVDPIRIMDMLKDNGDGTVEVDLYDQQAHPKSMKATKRGFSGNKLHNNSVSSTWIAVIQDAINDLFRDEKVGNEAVHKNGGYANWALNAIYGRSAKWAYCNDTNINLNVVLQGGDSSPVLMSTHDETDRHPLIESHVYSVWGMKGNNVVILRNPWGPIGGNIWGFTNKVEGATDLGEGIYEITLENFLRGCETITYFR
jgi:hypothetical protein